MKSGIWLVALAGLLASCTAPTFEEMAPFPCTTNGQCPVGLECVADKCIKPTLDASTGTGDSNGSDASAPLDARVDATIGDTSADGGEDAKPVADARDADSASDTGSANDADSGSGVDGGADADSGSVADIAVSPTSGLVVSESGTTATFTVRLLAAPTASVVVTLTSSSAADVTVSPSSLTFTTSNWATAQTATVTGVDDSVVDGTAAWTIRTAVTAGGDARYDAIDPPDVSGSTTDNEVIERLSVSSAFVEGNGHSGGLSTDTQVALGGPTISGDNRYIAFASEATNFIGTDINNAADVYYFDRVNRINRIFTGGNNKAGVSKDAVLSGDGKFVVFSTLSTFSSVVPGCVLMDIVSRVTTQISSVSGCTPYALSFDARYIAYVDPVPTGDSGLSNYQLRLYDKSTAASTLVATLYPSPNNVGLSSDGRYMAVCTATALNGGDSNGTSDVYVLDLMTATGVRHSLTAAGAQLSAGATAGAISGDGNYVTFVTREALVAQDTDTDSDLYIVNRVTGSSSVQLVSTMAQGGVAGLSKLSGMSTDGRYGVFEFTPTGSNEKQVWVFDRVAGTSTSVHKTYNGATPNGATEFPTISSDGSLIAFVGRASNLVASDTNAKYDIFLAPRP